MKIKRIQIENFQGLKGIHEIEFGSRLITALCGKNGTGKTSLLNALRYALTGMEPDGEMLTKNEARCTVVVELEDGSRFFRIRHANGGSKYRIGTKWTTRAGLNSALEDAIGIPLSAVKVASSAEVVAAMKPKEFGEFLLRYIPEEMDSSRVLSYIDDAPESAKEKVKEGLPSGLFGVSTLDEFFNTCREKRYALKKERDADKAVIDRLSVNKPDTDEAAAREKLVKMEAAKSDAVSYKTKLDLYNNVQKQKEGRSKMLADLSRKIEEIKAVNRPDEERKQLADALEKEQQALDNNGSMYKTLRANVEVLKKALENLSGNKCPLSDKLVCTTDKTAVRDELEATQKANLLVIQKQIDEGNAHKANIEKLKEKIRLFDEERAAYSRKAELIEQKAAVEKLSIPDVEKPEEVKLPSTEELESLRRIVKQFDDYQKAVAISKQLEKSEQELADWEYLCKAFEPKGIVKAKITDYYLDSFADACNGKAKEIKDGMSFKFVTDGGGVTVTADTTGSGTYLGYDSLSGGEKVTMLFILLDMINALSGLRIMLLDELSVLDTQGFDTMLSLITTHKDEYDMIVLGMVDHEDTVKSLKKYGIPAIDPMTGAVVSAPKKRGRKPKASKPTKNAVEQPEGVTTQPEDTAAQEPPQEATE